MMRILINKLVGVLVLAYTIQSGLSEVATKPGRVEVISPKIEVLSKVSEGNEELDRLLDAARSTIGVPYRWGGTQLNKSIDCSNYTWQLFRTVGHPYKRFLSTMVLSKLKRANGLRSISFEDARAGDLLVYGYRDASKRWYGHVVILIDKDGQTTGHRGLVLGAHGKPISSVQYITYTGFDKGYFKNPQMRLCNVLRVDSVESNERPD